MLYKRAVLKTFAIFTGKHLSWSLFLKVAGFEACTLLKETPTQVIFFEYSKIFNNTYFEKYLPTAASVEYKNLHSATESQTEMKFE